jgi:hypothetical protein
MAGHRRRKTEVSSKTKTPAKPPVQLQYLLWDATDPIDSNVLGLGLEKRFRWQNLLVDSPAGETFITTGPPLIFQPDAEISLTDGEVISRQSRGITELTHTFFDPVHHNTGSDRPALLAFSGHGMPGFMFGDHDFVICTSRPVTKTGPHKGVVDFDWKFDRRPVRPSPVFQWNHQSIKVVLLSACRQLQGRPQQFYWSRAMRGSNPVHMIVGYRETAPIASDSADINRLFLKNLFGSTGKDGQKILDAWKNAHLKVGLPRSWAALCYKSSRADRLDEWTRTGKLASTPDPKEDILYFDGANLSGRVVTEPHQDLDCFLTDRGGSDPFPLWVPVPKDAKLDLHIQFVNEKESFQNFDEIWIAASQVRPDFVGPFDMAELILFDVPPADDPTGTGEVETPVLIHDPSRIRSNDYRNDAYRFTIKDRSAASKFLKFDSTFNEMIIPIKMGGLQNNSHRACYFMVRVSNLDAPKSLKLPRREFGIPTIGTGVSRIADQHRLIDDFQFAVFMAPPWPPH